MAVGGTEQEILKIVAEAKRANTALIRKRLGLTPGYVEYLCQVLVRDRYLAESGSGVYALAQRGKKVLIDIGFAVGVDRTLLMDLAGEVAKAVAQQLKMVGGLRGPAAQEARERHSVEIQTDYPPPREEETARLTSNIEEMGIETEEEKADISESVRRYKAIAEGRRKRKRR